MKSLDLQPTKENLMDSLEKDSIGRNKDIVSFIDLLDYIDENCTIALDGRWGSGKTFFVKQTKMILDAYNNYVSCLDDEEKSAIKTTCNLIRHSDSWELQSHVSIYYDAWANDNDEDPMISLIYEIVKNINEDFPINAEFDFIKCAATLLDMFTGKSFSDLINCFKSDNPLEGIQKTKDFETTVKEFLDSLLAERGNRLVVFVDELDRCKPDYAVRLLERIKHYFSNDRITFVFSVNNLELQNTIRKHYGDDFDASRYLDRFFDLQLILPKADFDSFYKSIGFNSKHYYYDVVCDEISEMFDFSFRERAKFIRLAKMAAFKPLHLRDDAYVFAEEMAERFCLLYIVPLAIGLRIKDVCIYDRFLKGEDSLPLAEFASRLKCDWFDSLCSSNEEYEDNVNNGSLDDMAIVKLSDKIQAAYEAVFATKYTNQMYKKVVGKCAFTKSNKDIVFKALSLMSNYTLLND